MTVPTPSEIQKQFNQAAMLHQGGQEGLAAAIYEKILAHSPDHSDSLHLLGLIKSKHGKNKEAIQLISRAIGLQPNNVHYYYNRGLIFLRQREWLTAIQDFKIVIQLSPNYLGVYRQLGVAYQEMGLLDAAIQSLLETIKRDPPNQEALNHLGALYIAKEDYFSALDCFQRAFSIEDKPEFNTWLNMGAAWAALKNHAIACFCFTQAADIDPAGAVAYGNRALSYMKQCQFDLAKIDLTKAHKLAPNDIKILVDMSICYQEEGNLNLGLDYAEQALRIDPHDLEARFNRSMVLLKMKNYERGWLDYESRLLLLKNKSMTQSYLSRTQWQGEAGPGKTLMLYVEQGFGDALQWARYLPLVQARWEGTVILRCQAELVVLFSHNFPDIVFLRNDEPFPPFDCCLSLMSLSLLFQTSIESVPIPEGYLKAPGYGKVRPLLHAIVPSHAAVKRIGIVWGSGNATKINFNRSTRLKQWLGVLSQAHCQFYSFQLDAQKQELVNLPLSRPIIDLSPHIRDFADTAAFIQEMDLIITTDTALAHLAGALGKRAWVLLLFSSDFRWMVESEHTVWYKSLRLFRQKNPGDWGSVFSAVEAALADFLKDNTKSHDLAVESLS